MLIDNCGRPTLNLRVSLTQRCNLRCPYCHREGQVPGPAVREMTTKEVVRLVRVAASLGINRVKLTGGEPLLRTDIVEIVGGLAKIEDLRDLSMTTNGTHLSSLSEPLSKAGLMRINVNLPSLNEKTYSELNGGDLNDVLEGVLAAVEAGFYPVKLNMLLLRGINEHEVVGMMKFAEKSDVILQILELEPVSIHDTYFNQYHYPLDNVEEELKKQALSFEVRSDMQNRRVYTLPTLRVEVVHPLENSEFCARCTRLRLTSDGFLKPCLMVPDDLVDVLTPLRNGANDDDLKNLFVAAVKKREPHFKPSKH